MRDQFFKITVIKQNKIIAEYKLNKQSYDKAEKGSSMEMKIR